MPGDVVPFSPRCLEPPEIALYLRVGYSDHGRCDRLMAADEMPIRRFVFEAGNVQRQSSLISEARRRYDELVLDTTAAELSAIGCYGGSAKHAPWARYDRPLEPADFEGAKGEALVERIAEFAVAYGFTAVLAPAHLLSGEERWFKIDCELCASLRRNLDRRGRQDIAVDYPLIIPEEMLCNRQYRRIIIERLRPLPFEHLWLRIAGFGIDTSATRLRRIILASGQLHQIGRPVIADRVGGMAALATTAFGAASGFAHGLEGKERFDAKHWRKANAKRGFGTGRMIYIDALDRRLPVSRVRRLFETSETVRRILACRDQSCCSRTEDMLETPERHFLRDRAAAIATLSRIPSGLRAERFVAGPLDRLRERAAQAEGLRRLDDDARGMIARARTRLDRSIGMLTQLYETLGPLPLATTPFARIAPMRGSEPEMRDLFHG